MPLRLDSLKTRWPTFDLLSVHLSAPRVFKLWPSRGHFGTQAVPRETELVETLNGHHDRLPQDSRRPRIKGRSGTFIPSRFQLITWYQPKRQAESASVRRLRLPRRGLRRIELTEHRDGDDNQPTQASPRPRIRGRSGTFLPTRFRLITWYAPRNRSRSVHHEQLPLPIRRVGLQRTSRQELRSRRANRRKDYSPKFGSKRAETSDWGLIPQDRVAANFRSSKGTRRIQHRTTNQERKIELPMDGALSSLALKTARARVIGHVNTLKPGVKLFEQDHEIWTRQKEIHMHPRFTEFAVLRGSWHARFAALTYTGSRRHSPGVLNTDQKKDRAKGMLQHISIIRNVDSLTEIQQIWENLPHRRATAMWMELMMTTFEQIPEKALGMLSMTVKGLNPPPYVLGDSLDFIIAYHCLNRNKDFCTGPQLDNLAHWINQILIKSARPMKYGKPNFAVQLSPYSLRLLMSVLDGAQLLKLYENLLQTKQELNNPTLMQFAYRFAKGGETNVAFEVLQRLEGTSFNTPQMLSLCTVILCQNHRNADSFYSETTIFEFMIRCGLSANTITHNVLMRNSIQAGDHETAWKIHDMMLDAQIMPDKVTYSILLNNAKLRMDAVDIGKVMSYVREGKVADGPLITDVLHAIYLLQREKTRQARNTNAKENPVTALRGMLPVYSDNFELGPLARLIPGLTDFFTADLVRASADDEGKNSLAPHDGVLNVMLRAYLDGIQNAEAALQFYHHFRSLVYEGDPAVEQLVKSPRVWDMILITFGRFPELTSECAHIMEDMTNPVVKTMETAAAESVDEHFDPKSFRPSFPTPEPDLWTWSILLKVFMDAKQPAVAEKVLSLMKERKIEPSIVTWNTLAFGYVNLQDTDMVADAINRLEEADFEVDEATLNTLKKLKNRNKFLFKLAEKAKRRRLKKDLEEMTKSNRDAEVKTDAKAGEQALDEDEWLEEQFANENTNL